jgi:8-oxo-dGTP pyrophosphatase MutT (NUDIX family)
VEEAGQGDEVIRAAGGIVVRGDEVLIVEDCALREVEEETGFACEIARPLGESRYRVLGRPKVVRWFLMRPVDGTFAPGREVDEIAWVPRAEVRDRLTFTSGAEQLDGLQEDLRSGT